MHTLLSHFDQKGIHFTENLTQHTDKRQLVLVSIFILFSFDIYISKQFIGTSEVFGSLFLRVLQ